MARDQGPDEGHGADPLQLAGLMGVPPAISDAADHRDDRKLSVPAHGGS
jgi:hypothetical protein